MRDIEVKGLVLRTVDVSESDRMLTLYTEEMGLVSAYARGSRSLKSRKMSSTQQFCYASFMLRERSDKYWIEEAALIESFYGLRDNLAGLALAAYIAEVLTDVGTAEPEKDILRLALNSLYAISNGKAELWKIKGAFEVRVASVIGFMPDVISCHACGEGEGEFFFDIMAGAIECRECHKKREARGELLTDMHESHIVYQLSEGAKIAIGYCLYAPIEKLLSFSIGEGDIRLFEKAAEGFLLNHLERGFKTLDFYNEVKE